VENCQDLVTGDKGIDSRGMPQCQYCREYGEEI